MAGTLSVGNILLDSGSNNAPAIAATTSPTVGIVFPAANTMAFSTAGVERMRLDSATATLAIGTTTTTGSAGYSRIRMDGTTGSYISLLSNGTEQGRLITAGVSTALYSQTTNPLILGTGGTEKMRIDSSGNIGFGFTVMGGGSGRFRFSGNTTGSVTSAATLSTPTFLSDVTTSGYVYSSQPFIENTAFNLANLYHYNATGGSLSGSATIGTQIGYVASSSLTYANNNYGFSGGLTVSSINASAMSNTLSYTILTAGNTDFTQIGATSNTVGEFFTASNVQLAASTTGTVYENNRNLYMNGTAENRLQGYTIIDVSDPQAALRVTQRGSGYSLLVEDSTDPDTTPFVINGSGQVIIGYDTAITTLSPVSAIVPQVQILGFSTSTSSLGLARFGNDLGLPIITLTKSRSTTMGTFSANVASSDPLGQISFTGDDGGRAVEGARIYVSVDAAPASNSMPCRMLFLTTPSGANTPVERVRIDSVGYVGISTTTADANLSVGGVASFSDGTVSAPSIAHKGDLNCGIYFPAADTIGFTTAGTEAGRFDSTGNFTITNPAAKTGYGTGAGGAVTQLTNKSTAVTLNNPTGQITMNNASMAASSNVTFLLNNSVIAATDIVAVSGSGFAGPYVCSSSNVAAGSCSITVQNLSGSTLSNALKINFAVIKGVTS